MKSIELSIGDQARDISTKRLIEISLDNPPKDGFTLQDYRKRDRIQSALEKCNGHLELEDQDYENLKTCVNAVKWPFRHKFIVEFLESFENR